MIVLDVYERCHECPYFEPFMKRSGFYADGELAGRSLSITCKYENLCNNIKKHLDKEKEI